MIDEVVQPKVKQATADEIFFPQTRLDAVEPASLCWVAGRMVEARDGQTWAVEFARFSALGTVVRDNGSGLGKGLKLERARRRAQGQPRPRGLAGRLPHVPRRGPCPAEDFGGRPAAPLSVPRRPKRLDRSGRAGKPQTGYATATSRLWRQAEDFGIRRWPPRGPGS